MFSISGQRGKYPQVYFAEGYTHAYVGDFHKIQELVDNNNMPKDYLRLNPSYPTFERVFFEWADIAITGKGERVRTKIALKRTRQLELEYTHILEGLIEQGTLDVIDFKHKITQLNEELSTFEEITEDDEVDLFK